MAFATATVLLPIRHDQTRIGAVRVAPVFHSSRPRAIRRRNHQTWFAALSEAAEASSTSSTLDSPPKLDRVVCKFGGSSLADADRLREVANLVLLQLERTRRAPIVVLSAMGSSTNELLAAGERALKEGVVEMTSIRNRVYNACEALGLNAETLCDPLLTNLDQLLIGIKFIKELSPRTKDYLVSFGERLSIRIFAAHLNQYEDIEAKPLDSFNVGFLTDSDFTKAQLDDSAIPAIANYFENRVPYDTVAVVTGFIAKDRLGNMTTLGRGGSDLTASAIGAAVGVSEVQVWKDVDGILSTDPHIVEDAIPVASLSFEEAAEMAFFGAKILHPSAMQPAMRWNIPVRVKNSYNPDHPGTVIVHERTTEAANPVTAISLKKNVQIVDVVSTRMLGAYGFLAEVFKIFEDHKVPVDTIATSEVSISMTLDDMHCDAETEANLKKELSRISRVTFSANDKAIISLVSSSARGGEVVGRAVSSLNKVGTRILMISQGASKINISLVIDGQCAKAAVQAVHKEFFGF